MTWVTSLVGLVRGFHFLLRKWGAAGGCHAGVIHPTCEPAPHKTKLSGAKSCLFEPSSEGRCVAMSSGAPWLRGHKAAPSEEGGPGCAPAAPSPSREDQPYPQDPCPEQETGLAQLWVCLTLRVPESLESGGHRLGPDTQPPALL